MKNIFSRLALTIFVLALAFNSSQSQQVKLVKQLISNGGMVGQKSGNMTMSGNFGQSVSGYLDQSAIKTPFISIYQGYWGPVTIQGTGVEPNRPETQLNMRNHPNPFANSTTITYD